MPYRRRHRRPHRRPRADRPWLDPRGELKASKFGTRVGYRIRRADYDEFLRRTLTSAIARHLLALGATEPDLIA